MNCVQEQLKTPLRGKKDVMHKIQLKLHEQKADCDRGLITKILTK